MSTEVAKKRGRPKKVITEPVEVAVPEGAKKTATRAKSTKAAPKTTKATTSASNAFPTSNPGPESSTKSAPARKSPPKTSSPAPSPKAETKPPTTKTAPKVTPESSKILNELRQQTAKNASGASSPSSSQPSASAPTAPSQPKPSTPSAQPKTSPPPHKIPIAALNKQIVGDVTARVGARPSTGGPGAPLPKNYKSVANKVTMAMVAMPVALVTSWVLYERFVLGEDRKVLVRPKTPPEEAASSSSS